MVGRLVVAALGVSALGTLSELNAQEPVRTAVLFGTARDSASGRAVARRVCVTVPPTLLMDDEWCAPVDSTGAFRLDSLPKGRWAFALHCDALREFSHALALDSISVADSPPARQDWIVDTAG